MFKENYTNHMLQEFKRKSENITEIYEGLKNSDYEYVLCLKGDIKAKGKFTINQFLNRLLIFKDYLERLIKHSCFSPYSIAYLYYDDNYYKELLDKTEYVINKFNI